MKLRVVFMGTPMFAVPALKALLENHEVAAVLTQPDRPAGRGNKLAASPVKEAALAAGINVLQPQTLFIKKNKTDETAKHTAEFVRSELKTLQTDVFVVAAYGLMLPKGVLDMPRLACVNVHASLLPRWRGASPIHAAVLHGDERTGVTIMHMAEGMDTGDIILQRDMGLAPDEHFPSVHDRMAVLGSTALLEALTALANGTAERKVQDETLATYAPMINKTDGLIDWTRPSHEIINKIRAFDPWPTAYTQYNGEPLKIWRAYAQPFVKKSFCEEEATQSPPGTVLSADNHGLVVSTGDGAITITELQGTNSKKMPAHDYLRGRHIPVGTIF
jgi:methionyl-tRNA formyltransferase